MAGLFVVFIISWFLLVKLKGESIEAIGLLPTKQRLVEFFAGMFFMASIAVINFV